MMRERVELLSISDDEPTVCAVGHGGTHTVQTAEGVGSLGGRAQNQGQSTSLKTSPVSRYD